MGGILTFFPNLQEQEDYDAAHDYKIKIDALNQEIVEVEEKIKHVT